MDQQLTFFEGHVLLDSPGRPRPTPATGRPSPYSSRRTRWRAPKMEESDLVGPMKLKGVLAQTTSYQDPPRGVCGLAP